MVRTGDRRGKLGKIRPGAGGPEKKGKGKDAARGRAERVRGERGKIRPGVGRTKQKGKTRPEARTPNQKGKIIGIPPKILISLD